MKRALICVLTLLASTKVLAINESIEVNEKEKVNQTIEKNILETANLMDEINLLKLKLEKEMLDKSLNEERVKNIAIQHGINKFHNKKEIKKHNPADGPFDSNGIRLLSVTSLQNMGEMVSFSFYGRKYNRTSGEQFKGSRITINNDYVIFKYRNKNYKFSY